MTYIIMYNPNRRQTYTIILITIVDVGYSIYLKNDYIYSLLYIFIQELSQFKSLSYVRPQNIIYIIINTLSQVKVFYSCDIN
jgi:hypothetical protein